MGIHYIVHENLALAEERYDDVVDSVTAINGFLDLWVDPEFCGVGILVNSRDMRYRNAFGVTRDMPYLRLSAEDYAYRNTLVEVCSHRGHLSLFFFPKKPLLFLEKFHSLGYYPDIETEEEVCATSQVSGLPAGTASELDLFMSENAHLDLSVGCAFSHDADLFYELHFHR